MDKVLAAFQLQQAPGTAPAQIEEANRWLEQFQKTAEAWTVADQLLQQPADPTNGPLAASHIFAAQTMRTKIVYDWNDLPAEAHTSLRQSLLDHVVRFGQGPQPVLTQLCLAVGVLALRMDSWPTVVNDLISSLTQPAESATAKLPCLLEMLTVLPEEAENYRVNVLPRRRDEFRALMRAAGPQVLGLLGSVCTGCTGATDILQRMLRCISAWMRHVDLPTEQLAASPVLPFGFSALVSSSEDYSDAASDMMIEAVHFSQARRRAPQLHTTNRQPANRQPSRLNPLCPPRAPQDAEKHQALVTLLLPAILQLVPAYDAAVAEATYDEDAARNLCRIFAESGEQYMRLLLQHPQAYMLPLAGAVLRGASHPEPEIAEITFNFWYVLSEEVASGRATSDPKGLTPAKQEECKALFAPLFLQLIEHLRKLAELPPDSDSWTADTHDDFKRFRYAVGDAINDSCKVASSVSVIGQLMGTLQPKLAAFAADPQAHWREIEGCVFCLRQSISKNDPTFFSSPAVAQLLQLLPTLPEAGTLVPTCIRTVGTYSAWLSRNPEHLPPLLTFVSNGLSVPASAPAASHALKHLCDACSEHLADEATMAQLLTMYRNALALSLQAADRIDLVAALAYVVSNMAPAQILPTMGQIASPLVEALQQQLASPSGSASEVCLLLEQLCALLRTVDPRPLGGGTDAPALQDAMPPALELLSQLWDVLASVFTRFSTSSQCMEKLCRCYKHTQRACGDAFQAIVPRLLPQVTGWYEQQPWSCFVYMCNACLSSFPNPRDGTPALPAAVRPVVSEAFQRIATATFTLLSSGANGIVDNPDVVDDFFELCSKVLRKEPSLLLESTILQPAVQCGTAALHVQHKEAGRSTFCFFENLIEASGPRTRTPVSPAGLAALQGVLGEHGPKIVSQIILAVAGMLPAQRVRFLSPLLQQIVHAAPGPSREWVTAAVRAMPAGAHADGGVLIESIFSAEALVLDPHGDKTFLLAVDVFSDGCRRKRITG